MMKTLLCSTLLLVAAIANGQTLYRQTSNITNPLYTISFADDNIGVTAGANRTLASTIDAGQHWNPGPPGSGNFWNAYFFDTSAAAIGGDSGRLLVKLPGLSAMPVQLPV